MQRKISHCHKALAKIAKELAAASYDELMSFNPIYESWKKRYPGLRDNPKRLKAQFVMNKWGLYVTMARATLTAQLLQPIDENVKDEIMEILALDSSLIRGRVNPAMIAGAIAPKS